MSIDRCELCAKYKTELEDTEAKKGQFGKNWYSRTRSKINHRATRHKDSMHPNLDKLNQLIQTKQAELNRLFQERMDKKEKKEREQRRLEKEEEEERRLNEQRNKRRRF